MSIEWSKTLVPIVALLVLGALVYKGILHPEALLGVVGVLVPSPIATKPKEPTNGNQ
jgi:hypothetical protein